MSKESPHEKATHVAFSMSRTRDSINVLVSPLTRLYLQLKDGAFIRYHKQPSLLPVPHLRMFSVKANDKLDDAIRLDHRPIKARVQPDGFALFAFPVNNLDELRSLEPFGMTLCDLCAVTSSKGTWQLPIPLTERKS